MPSEELQEEATSASQWRSPRRDGFLIKLPSGNKARVRRTLDLLYLMKAGRIPNPLGKIVNEMIQGKRQNIELNDLDPRALQQMLAMLDEVCCRAMVEPVCQMPPADADPLWQAEDGAISVYDVGTEDKLAIFTFAQGGVQDMEPFRTGADGDLAPAPDGEEVHDKAQLAAGLDE